jgi:hypothetical protein
MMTISITSHKLFDNGQQKSEYATDDMNEQSYGDKAI